MLGSTVSPVIFSSEGCSLQPFFLGGLYQRSLALSDSAFLVLQLPSSLHMQIQTTNFKCTMCILFDVSESPFWHVSGGRDVCSHIHYTLET